MQKQSISDREYLMFGLKIMGDFGVTLAAPIIVFVLGGRWLDQHYDKRMLFTVIAFVLAMIVSGVSIVRKARRYGKVYQQMVNRE